MGGPGHPPDKPYQVITLADDDAQASAQLQAALDAGYGKIYGFSNGRVIVGNYRDQK